MESLSSAVSLPAARFSSRVSSLRGRLREQVTTTPGRLVLVSALVVAGALCFGVLATAAEQSRDRAADSARSQTEPLLAQAATLYTALADANATVTTTFAAGGLEPPALRASYIQDLRSASDSLAMLTRAIAASASARAAVTTITEELPSYAGLVETARADNLQGLPVGAAYLRAASSLLTNTILPEADRLYATEAIGLSDDYHSGTSIGALVVLVIVVVAALALLVLAQVYVARISRRMLNVPMLIATALLASVSVWSIIGLADEQSALGKARRNGSDSVEVLSAARVLVARAQSDQSLILVSRGSDETDPIDFGRVEAILSPPDGLIGEAQALSRRVGAATAADRLGSEFESFVSAPTSSANAARLTGDLGGQVHAAQARFVRAADDATSSLSGLWLAIPLLTALAAVLALTGLRQRLGEYR